MVVMSLDPNGPGGWPGSGSPPSNELMNANATVQEGKCDSDARGAECCVSILEDDARCFLGLGLAMPVEAAVLTRDIFSWQENWELRGLRGSIAAQELVLGV